MVNKTLNRMDIMEINLKVKQNQSHFLPARAVLPSSSSSEVSAWIDPFFIADYHLGGGRVEVFI